MCRGDSRHCTEREREGGREGGRERVMCRDERERVCVCGRERRERERERVSVTVHFWRAECTHKA